MTRSEKAVGVLLIVLAFLAMGLLVCAKAQPAADTGWRSVASGAVANEFFYRIGSTTGGLRCDWVLVRVASNADSLVYIQRSDAGNLTHLRFMDEAGILSVEPGASILLTGRSMNAMRITRAGAASDVVTYIAGGGIPPSHFQPAAASMQVENIDLTGATLEIDLDTSNVRLGQIRYQTGATRAAVGNAVVYLTDIALAAEAIQPNVDTLVTRATLANSRLATISTRTYQTRDNVAVVRDTLTTSNVWLKRIRDSVDDMSISVGDINVDMTVTEGKLDTVISTIEGMWTSLETDMVSIVLYSGGTIDTAGTVGGGDTLMIDMGDIRSYAQMYVRINATTWGDSLVMQVGSSDNNGWDTGNTCYFDFAPSPDMPQITHFTLAGAGGSYGTYGVTIALQDHNGAWLPGPYGVLRFINYGGTGHLVTGFTVMGLYGKGR